MDNFDPFSSGAATAVGEPPKAATDGFDPFASGAATLAEGPAQPVLQPLSFVSKEDPDAHWRNLYGGLKGLDQRVDAAALHSITQLDKLSRDPEEHRARAINQTFIAEKLKTTGAALDNNWGAVKSAFAKQELSIDQTEISDKALYGWIGQRLHPPAQPSVDQTGEIKPWTWTDSLASDVYQAKKNVGNFWTGLWKPFHEIPEAPTDLPDVSIQGGLGTFNPAVLGGVWNGAIKPLVEGLESPAGIATLGVGSTLGEAAKLGSRPAAIALKGMTGFFAALMGKGAVQSGTEFVRLQNDPNATTQQKITALSSTVSGGVLSVLGAFSTAFGKMAPAQAERLAGEIEGKTPAQSVDLLRVEANRVPLDQKPALLRAADSLETSTGAPEQPVKAFTKEEIAQEVGRTPPEKLAEVAGALQKPNIEFQYSVWDKDMIPPGADRVAQVDIIPKDGEGPGGGLGSTNRKVLANFGVDLPAVPDWVPPGRYTLPEIQELIRQGPNAGSLKVEAAAVRTEDGQIVEGATHEAIADKGATGEEGFTLSNGKFVDRAEAVKVAEKSGQLMEGAIDTPAKRVEAKAEATAIEATTADEHLSSVKRASVDAQLERMGFDPTTPSETRSWSEGVKGALERFDKDPERGANLVRKALSGETRFSTEDVWDSQVYERRLKDEITVAEKRYDEALIAGDPVAIDAADAELYEKQATFKQASQAFNEVMGSEAGRALNARKAMLRDDYSLAALERKYRRATGSADVPENIQKELSEKADKIAELEAALKKSLEQKARIAPPSDPRVRVPKASQALLDRLSTKADEARERLSKRAGLSAGVVGDEGTGRASIGKDLQDYSIIVADMLAKGVTKTAEISARLVKEFGEKIRPHVDAIVQLAKDNVSAEKLSLAIDRRKAALEKRISELAKQIETGDVAAKGVKANRPAVEDIEKLEQKRDALNEELRLKRETRSKVRELQDAIAEKERKIAEGDLAPKEGEVNRPDVEPVEKLKQERDALNQELSDARKAAAAPTEDEVIQKKVAAIQDQISKQQEKLRTGDLETEQKAANRPQVREIEEAKQELEKVNAELAEARKGPPKTKEEKALSAWRARTEKEIARLEKGEPKPEVFHVELPFSPRDLEMKKQLETLKKDVAAKLKAEEDARRPIWLKGLDKVKWAAETSILTSLGIFLKIPVSAFWKTATGPFKSLVGVTAGKIFPRAAEFADMQVQPTYASALMGEAKAAKSTVTSGLRAAGEAFRNRLTQEETLYVPDSMPPSGKDFVRSIHKALHIPAQINEFSRVVSAIENNLIAAGKGDTLTDPAVWTTVRVRAYNEAYRAAYLEKDALMSGLIDSAIRSIEQKGKKYNAETLAAIITMAIEMDNPIKRVPVNIISQTGEAVAGSVVGTAQILNAYRNGFEKMKPGDLDAAFRRVKSGTVGAIAMVGAWYAYENLGGSKVSGSFAGKPDKKDKPGEPHQGQVKVGGSILPEMGFHNETWAAAQMVASYRHLLADQYGKKHVEMNADSFLRAAIGPVEDMPGIRQSLFLTMSKTKTPTKTLAQWAASRAVPAGVAQIARWLDTKGELSFETFRKEPTKRFPSSAAEEFEARIPGLRSDLPRSKGEKERRQNARERKK